MKRLIVYGATVLIALWFTLHIQQYQQPRETIDSVYQNEIDTIYCDLRQEKELPLTTLGLNRENTTEEEMQDIFTPLDIPLDEELQKHVFEISEEYKVDPYIIFGMIERESDYKADAVGDGGDSLGLMQIQTKWHKARMDKLGVTDLLEPYGNIQVGVDFLAECYYSTSDYNLALVKYNSGKAGAESKYSRYVLDKAEELKNAHR
jgi:soluble lytic murein transglycosylase-like protein